MPGFVLFDVGVCNTSLTEARTRVTEAGNVKAGEECC